MTATMCLSASQSARYRAESERDSKIKLKSSMCGMLQVRLPGCYVGRIAVGMQHAAALAELLEAQSPVSQVRLTFLYPSWDISQSHMAYA